eukprot:56984_1
MIVLVITVCSLWTRLHAATGCSNNAVEERSIAGILTGGVYACRGVINSGGSYGDDAAALCGDTYHVCDSAIDAESLGLTIEKCSGIAANVNEFFATKETSDGAGRCYSHRGGDPENIGVEFNDCWGCGHPNTTLYGKNSPCGALGYGITDWWIARAEGWSLPTGLGRDRYMEADRYMLTDATYGGVLCCKDTTDVCQREGYRQNIEHGCRCLANCGGQYCQNGASFGINTGGDACPGSSVCCCGGGCKAGAMLFDHDERVKERPRQNEFEYEPEMKAMPRDSPLNIPMVVISILTSMVVTMCTMGCVFFIWLAYKRPTAKYLIADDESDTRECNM